jgi:GDPmannose 4,6-dehydratase
MKNKVIIVGSDGQDGTILKNKLNQLNYNIVEITKNNFDISNKNLVFNLIKKNQPNKIFYLASYHHSSDSNIEKNKNFYELTHQINYTSPHYFLDAILNYNHFCKFFYASTSMIYGHSNKLINENSFPSPDNDYGYSKLYGMQLCNYYRINKKLFVSTGILFNHTSSHSKDYFIAKKIIKTAILIYKKKSKKLIIGNLNAELDLGSAYDYVDAIIKISNLKKSDNFIISSGKKIFLKQFINEAFKYLKIDYKKYVFEDSLKIIRKNKKRIGDSTLLYSKTGWKPKFTLKEIVKEMIDHELSLYF